MVASAKGSNVVFLKAGNPNAKEDKKAFSKSVGASKSWAAEQLITDYLSDCDKVEAKQMSATALQDKYRLTYSSWKNMKTRCKKHGFLLSQEFEEFRWFLRHCGPRLHEKFSLDRIDYNDLEYGPGKVEWRDDYAQNNNKGNNVWLTSKTGEKHTIAQWSKIKNMNPSSMYKHHKAGWSDQEVLDGKCNMKAKASPSKPDVWAHTPWPIGKEMHCEQVWTRDGLLEDTREEWFLRRAEGNHTRARLAYEEIDLKLRELYELADCYGVDVDKKRVNELQAPRAAAMVVLKRAADVLRSAKEHEHYRRRLAAVAESASAKDRKSFISFNPKPPRLPSHQVVV